MPGRWERVLNPSPCSFFKAFIKFSGWFGWVSFHFGLPRAGRAQLLRSGEKMGLKIAPSRGAGASGSDFHAPKHFFVVKGEETPARSPARGTGARQGVAAPGVPAVPVPSTALSSR